MGLVWGRVRSCWLCLLLVTEEMEVSVHRGWGEGGGGREKAWGSEEKVRVPGVSFWLCPCFSSLGSLGAVSVGGAQRGLAPGSGELILPAQA